MLLYDGESDTRFKFQPFYETAEGTVNSSEGKTTNLYPSFYGAIASYKLLHNGDRMVVLLSLHGSQMRLQAER